MQLTKDKRTGAYTVRVYDAAGKAHTLSTGARDKNLARRIAKQAGLDAIELQARTGKLTNQAIAIMTSAKQITVSRAIEEYQQRMTHWSRSANFIYTCIGGLNQWAKFSGIGRLSPANVTDEHVDKWINRPDQIKASYRSLQLSWVTTFLDFCVSSGYRIGNPARLVKVDLSKLGHELKERRPRQCYSDAEIDRLVAVAKEMHGEHSFWPAAILIARYTALRLSDIAGLEWQSLAKPGFIICWTRKKDKRVEVPIKNPKLQAALDGIDKEDETYCFPFERKVINRPHSRGNFSDAFANMARNAGIVGKNFHDLRSTALTDLMAQGMPIEHIMRYAGHSHWSTTSKYIVEKV